MDIAEESKLKQLARETADATGPEDDIENLLNWNNLTYTMPVTNSVVTSRNLKSFAADMQDYTVTDGQQMLITVQTGSQYVDWTNSFLEFDLEVTPSADFELQQGIINFRDGQLYPNNTDPPAHRSLISMEWAPTYDGKRTGHGGSVLNLIDRIVLTSRSGVELQRVENFNKYHALLTSISKPQSWKDTVGKALQISPLFSKEGIVDGTEATWIDITQVGAAGDDITMSTTDTAAWQQFGNYTNDKWVQRYSIPMECFGGLFDTKQLCPAMIASGLRIEIYFSDPKKALTCCDLKSGISFAGILSGSLAFSVRQPQLVADTITLNDAAMKQLNMTSADNGLEYVYNGVFSQKHALSGTSVELQCSKAVSRALVASAVHYNPVPSAPHSAFCHLGSSHFFDKYQFRLGSQYFPHQPIRGKQEGGEQSVYMNVLYATDVLNKNVQNGYLYDRDFKGPINRAARPMIASFERSNLLRFSGVPINNSRTLSLSAEMVPRVTAIPGQTVADTDKLEKGQVLLFLTYVQLSKAFLNNIVVSI